MAEQPDFFDHAIDEFIASVRDVRLTQLISCTFPVFCWSSMSLTAAPYSCAVVTATIVIYDYSEPCRALRRKQSTTR